MPVIEFQDVSFAYHPNHLVIHSISFIIEKGESIVLLGENGSGKSTIFLNLLHLISGHQGKILINGIPVNHKNEKKIRQQVGLIFQNSNDQLFLPTVKEELAFGPWNLGFRNQELETRIKIAAKAIGVENLLNKKIFHLSQGEKKKVAIAAVYAMNPDIYLFDEPFANLDPKTKADLIAILESLYKEGKTILLISHEVDQIPKFFSRAIVLHSGNKTFDGSLRSLYQNASILDQANLRVPLVANLYNFIERNYPSFLKSYTGKIPIDIIEFEQILKLIFDQT